MVVPGLKARYINVYLPSEAAKLQWEEDAKDAGIPLSRFVFEAVEAFRASKKETPKLDFVKDLLRPRKSYRSSKVS